MHSIDYPELVLGDRKCPHGVILKTVATNICGSDQHMVRGRTTAPSGLILGHEITGEIIEKGRDVEFLKVGDLVSVPFNIACGRCRNCKEGKTGICLNVNPARPGAAAAQEHPATVLNSIMEVAHAGASLGIPGLYVTGDPGAVDEKAKIGMLGIRIGLGWAKSHQFTTGQCPVMRYHRQLMNAILYDKVQIAKATNVTVISLDQAPQGYMDFDKGAARKFVIDPHGLIAA